MSFHFSERFRISVGTRPERSLSTCRCSRMRHTQHYADIVSDMSKFGGYSTHDPHLCRTGYSEKFRSRMIQIVTVPGTQSAVARCGAAGVPQPTRLALAARDGSRRRHEVEATAVRQPHSEQRSPQDKLRLIIEAAATWTAMGTTIRPTRYCCCVPRARRSARWWRSRCRSRHDRLRISQSGGSSPLGLSGPSGFVPSAHVSP